MPFKRLLVIIIPLVTLVLLNAYLLYPEYIYVVIALINIFVFYTVWRFARSGPVREGWMNYVILPACFITGSIAYTTIITDKLLIESLFIVTAIFIYIHLRRVYTHLSYAPGDREGATTGFFAMSGWLSFLFISITVFGLRSFLNISAGLIAMIVIVVTFLLSYQGMQIDGIQFRKSGITVLTVCMVMAELGWALTFLPVRYIVAGFILSIYYYMLSGLARLYLLGKLDDRTVKFYLGMGSAGISIVLLTARWL